MVDCVFVEVVLSFKKQLSRRIREGCLKFWDTGKGMRLGNKMIREENKRGNFGQY